MEMLPTFPAPNYRIVTTEDGIKDLIDMPADMEMTDLEKKYAKIIPYGAGADYIQMLRDVYNLKIMKFNHRRDTWNIPHPTLVQNTRHIHNLKNRWLTIAEAKRLAGFPDDFILTGSTTDQYERLGRAVPPIGMACFANHIKSIQDTLYDMGKIEIEKR
jgi:DNA (cytosine-5)-methyltransferase 1